MHDVKTIPTDVKVKAWSDITPEAPDWQFRISFVKGIETLWRRNNHPAFYGGHQIMRIALDTRLAREWLEAAGYDTFDLNMRSKD
jgi:hypothetical protein